MRNSHSPTLPTTTTTLQYSWPGNEEELRTTVERAAQQQLQQISSNSATTSTTTGAPGSPEGLPPPAAAETNAGGVGQQGAEGKQGGPRSSKARAPGGLQLGAEDVGVVRGAKERQVVIAEELVWFGGQVRGPFVCTQSKLT